VIRRTPNGDERAVNQEEPLPALAEVVSYTKPMSSGPLKQNRCGACQPDASTAGGSSNGQSDLVFFPLDGYLKSGTIVVLELRVHHGRRPGDSRPDLYEGRYAGAILTFRSTLTKTGGAKDKATVGLDCTVWTRATVRVLSHLE